MAEHSTTVLVIDDDKFVRERTSQVLRRAGFSVRTAGDCEKAWALLEADPSLRLIVCDWLMPGMSGLQFVKRLRAHPCKRSAFVLICTSNTKNSDVDAAYAAGADDYVAKPWRAGELVARVRAGQNRLALDTSEALIFSLASLAESRDPDMGAHLERVQHYCRLLTRALAEESDYADEIDNALATLIEKTSVLHDIGKVGIPDAILQKPSRLTSDEFNVMKSHTRIGADTLNTALKVAVDAPFLNVAYEIALYHHEHWDGSGYPVGLSGCHIPLAARILAVADVYDALTSRRVYKDVISHEAAKQTIVQCAGTQFDPLVVAAFLECERGFIDIRERYSDRLMPPRDVTSTSHLAASPRLMKSELVMA